MKCTRVAFAIAALVALAMASAGGDQNALATRWKSREWR